MLRVQARQARRRVYSIRNLYVFLFMLDVRFFVCSCLVLHHTYFSQRSHCANIRKDRKTTTDDDDFRTIEGVVVASRKGWGWLDVRMYCGWLIAPAIAMTSLYSFCAFVFVLFKFCV